jgi:KaiC/GvpD/RAD55 family RecA-like ATPase
LENGDSRQEFKGGLKVRVPTGIEGLDTLIEGGFAKDTVNLVVGPPGSGKTLFAAEFIYNGARFYDEKGVFLALEESRDNVLRAITNFSPDFEDMVNKGLINLIDFGEIRKSCDTDEELKGEVASLATIQKFLNNYIDTSGAKRVVVDSLSAISLYYPMMNNMRRELFRFARFLKDKGVTSVVVSELITNDGRKFNVEQFVSDSVIMLGYENVNNEFRRTVTVYKMRFTKHDPYKHPFRISEEGIEVWPKEQIF